jgi:hypothetical protein
MYILTWAHKPIAFYDGTLMLLYDSSLAKFPIFVFFWEQDLIEFICLSYPEIYKELRGDQNILLSFKTVFLNMTISFFQATVLFFLTIAIFHTES